MRVAFQNDFLFDPGGTPWVPDLDYHKPAHSYDYVVL